jgi:hypothetical protein
VVVPPMIRLSGSKSSVPAAPVSEPTSTEIAWMLASLPES